MCEAVARLREALNGINTGVARPALLESVRVEAYGELVQLSHVATVTGGGGARSLRVVPFDSSLVGAVTKAIQSAGLGLNPQPAGTSIVVVVPAPDGDQRQRLVARARSLAEQQRVAVRNVRKDARNAAKRDGSLAADEKRIDELAVAKVAEIDGLLKAKVDEIEWLDPRWNTRP